MCRTDLYDVQLQKTLDYACGGGADCRPILKGGACFTPDTVKAHCSYAVNSYYQRSGQNPQACVFSTTTFVTPNDPSTCYLFTDGFIRRFLFSSSSLSLPDPYSTVQYAPNRTGSSMSKKPSAT